MSSGHETERLAMRCSRCVRKTILTLVLLLFLSCEKGGLDPNSPYTIFSEEGLAFGFGLGAELCTGSKNWVDAAHGCLQMSYPPNQKWGAVFITVGGDPVPPPRPCEDFSGYSQLVVVIRGATGGEHLFIGIKDNSDPDTGEETKIRVSSLSTSWEIRIFDLKYFVTADLTRIYVPVEFVFECTEPQTVYVKNIQYMP